MEEIKEVSIKLKPNVYTTFRNLVNSVSNTLSEYVDNALQSYLSHKDDLLRLEKGYKLTVSIDIDFGKSITIRDNAAGIDSANYLRAFEPAHVPIDSSGLWEFGMGMKTASIWLANNFRVETKALGEPVKRITMFDLDMVTSEGKESLIVRNEKCDEKEHYTLIELTNLSIQAPSVNQLFKIKNHLSSIYRRFLRTGELILLVNGETLEAPEYAVLNAPYYKTPDASSVLWRREIDFKLGKYSAKGFVAILEKMQNGASGLVLLRRGRVILGVDGDERYMPRVLFGQPGSFRSRRLFGEIEIEGFGVTFNKNGIKEEEDLSVFIEKLTMDLKSSDFDLLGQTDNYRQKSKEQNEVIAKKIEKIIKKEEPQIANIVKQVETSTHPTLQIENAIEKAKAISSNSWTFPLQGVQCTISIEFISDTNLDVLYWVTKKQGDGNLFGNEDVYQCKINLAHPFFARYPQISKEDDYMPIYHIFKALAIAEIVAPTRGLTNVSILRSLFNQFIGE